MQEEQFYLLKKVHWTVRYGSTILFLALFLCIFLSLTVSYSDRAMCEATIHTQFQPNELSTLSNNIIEKVYISDNQYVETGNLLISWKGTESANEMLRLDSLLQKTSKLSYNHSKMMSQCVKNRTINEKLLSLVNIYENQYFNSSNKFEKKSLSQINEQIALLQKSIIEMKGILDVSQKELTLSKSQFNDIKQLYSSGAVGKTELETAKSREFQKEKEVKQLQLNITEKETEKKRLQAQIGDVEKQYALLSNDAELQIQSISQEIKALIETWKLDYLVVATNSGVVSFLTNLQSGQYIPAGTNIISIVPSDKSTASNTILATAYMPSSQAPLVKEGQKALIELNGYPALKHGYIEGVVSKKSLTPKDNFYYLSIDLKQQLRTDKGFEIPFEQKMKGTMSVITDKRSIADRILGFLTGRQH